MNRKRIRTFVGIACLLAAASFPLSAQEYRIVELGTLGGPGSIAVAISENGIISGWAMLPSGEWHAVIWDRSGIVDLGTPPGAIESRANAANEFGQVAANAEVGPQSQGYLVENGIWTPIGNLPGTSESRANDIDSGGRIVGSSYTPDGVSRAIIWDAGVLTDLGTLFSTASAVAINEAGQVVGVADIGLPAGGQEFRGFLWENGQMTALDPLPGDFRSSAADINEVGQICGRSTNAGSPPYFLSVDSAVLWENGTVIDLGSVPGYGLNSASAINNHGQVVGTGAVSHTNSSLTKAFIWQDGVIQNLIDLVGSDTEWALRSATGINDAGQIVGNGLASPDHQARRAFLLEPLIPCSGDSECDDGFFCDGVEECVDGICREGSNSCPGLVCDEGTDICEPPTCNFDGSCDLGENCNSCPDDCVSNDGSQSCGDGICQPGIGEDCLSCASDCRSKQKGSPSSRFCCGADVGCTDARCNADTWICDDTQPASSCCGDGACDPGENQCDCPVDCGASAFFTEANCTDGVDNDCDSLTDEADRDCCAQEDDACYIDADCCSANCKKSNKFPYLGTCR
jgi:probable HAF family extracellular repeat protein